MKVNALVINLTSENPERLQAFYRDVVGLPAKPDMGEGAFDAAGATIIIDGHSETRGSTKEPARSMVNLFVDDIAAEQERLTDQGVKFIRSQGKEFWGGVISTFVDPDGNYCQIIQFAP